MSRPIPLATTRWGTGPSRVLLLHGILSSGASWWRVAAGFTERGYEATAPDLRGHGATPPQDDMSIAASRDDVLGLGESWDLVLGHSLGGAIALLCQAVRPTWASRLVLEDPALLMGDPDLVAAAMTDPWNRPIDVETIGAANPRWHPRDVEIEVASLQQCRPGSIERTIRDSAPYDLRPLVAALDVPTLLLGADPQLDPVLPQTLGEELAAANHRVDFSAVAGGSHSMHRDAHDGFWASIDRFLVATAV